MLGERLEEARKRKGVSIREAAEATKIRGDYLLAMEDNSFEIDLPQIYIRGFLRNYARYLKLDPNKALTDYDAHMLGKSHRSPRSNSRESLGQVAIPQPDEEPSSEEDNIFATEAPAEEGPEPKMSVRLGSTKKPTAAPPTLDREATRRDEELWNENKGIYIKIGIISAAVIVVSIFCLILWQLLRSDGAEPAQINPDLATNTSSVSSEPLEPVVAVDAPIVLTASDSVTLIVEQTIDRKRLYSGTLNTGESLSLERQGPVSLRFTNGAALRIEVDGKLLRTGTTGLGRTVID
jgi:transcriptional regulator with XRE-family HTH domain